ncbi:MAG: hypothetical protein ACRYFW_10805 [Janthinobacterium lividum]
MTTPPGPTDADLRRLRMSRVRARLEVAAAQMIYRGAKRAAFRRELAATVRCASPFLVSLLAIDELALGDVVMAYRKGADALTTHLLGLFAARLPEA